MELHQLTEQCSILQGAYSYHARAVLPGAGHCAGGHYFAGVRHRDRSKRQQQPYLLDTHRLKLDNRRRQTIRERGWQGAYVAPLLAF